MSKDRDFHQAEFTFYFHHVSLCDLQAGHFSSLSLRVHFCRMGRITRKHWSGRCFFFLSLLGWVETYDENHDGHRLRWTDGDSMDDGDWRTDGDWWMDGIVIDGWRLIEGWRLRWMDGDNDEWTETVVDWWWRWMDEDWWMNANCDGWMETDGQMEMWWMSGALWVWRLWWMGTVTDGWGLMDRWRCDVWVEMWWS
jgi:hypothetical protein